MRFIKYTFLSVWALIALSSLMIGNDKLNGQELYREYCRPCHTEESAYGHYTPMSLIQDQWDTFFKKRFQETHSTLSDPHHGGGSIFEVLTAEQIKAIYKFSFDHAADSEQPMSCDQPPQD